MTAAPPSSSPTRSTPRLPNWLGGVALLLPSGVWLLLLLVLPTLFILELSFVPACRPADCLAPYGLENYVRLLFRSVDGQLSFDLIYLKVIVQSFGLAAATTGLCLLLGFPVAYWLAIRSPARWRNLLLLAFVLPLWTSSLLRSYAWVTILRSTGVLNTVLDNLGLLGPLESLGYPESGLLNRPIAVLIGMTYSYLPYIVLILYSSLEKLDRQLLEAAADLGAYPRTAFWQITVPQSAPGILAGSLLVFITGLGDFVDPELLGGSSSMTLARLIYNQFLKTRNWGFGASLSMILILAVSIAVALLIKYGDSDATTSA
ncbi:MAG: ABC transporter permease [Prochlorothrix sp.]|nr:ABC transporter permease [Prochlorothrix sp.]